jgi:hypothetical protein
VSTDRATQLSHLGRLAAALAGSGVSAEVNAAISRPCLRVAITATPARCERVYCDRTDDAVWMFSWQWDEAIGSAWELRDRCNELEHSIAKLDAEDKRLPRLLGELNMIIAVQEDRAGTPLCFVRDKPQGVIA